MKYSCSLNGKCEPDPVGAYSSLEECRANCDSVLFADLLYIIMSYSPEEALRLSPTDMIRIANNITDSNHTADSARYLLEALKRDDIFKLIQYPTLDIYILNLVGIKPENIREATSFIKHLRTATGYDPRSTTVGDLDYDRRIERKEREKIKFLLHYPVLYELLKEHYDTEVFGEIFMDEVANVATVQSFELLQSLETLEAVDEDMVRQAYRTMYRKASDDYNLEVMSLLKDVMDSDDYEDEADDYEDEADDYDPVMEEY